MTSLRSYRREDGDHGSRLITVDDDRDGLLTAFGRETLKDRYLMPGESYQDLFARVACAYSDDEDHAQRLYDYMSQLWFMPATPVLSNGGTSKGLPISCYLNAVEDNLESIVGSWNENVWLAAKGGGIGTYWGGVRSIGESVHGVGKTSGVVPFQVVQNYLTLAISQGSQRRGAGAMYLDIHHPEVVEFLEIRKPTGDFNRKALNMHHGLCIDDVFMHAVRDGATYALRSPKTGEPISWVDARTLWQKVLEIRLQTGEPYLIFRDTANRAMARHQQDLGLRVKQSNLCAEIMLHSGKDHLGVDRTAVCCLSSVNAEKWLEWVDHPTFVEDLYRFLDNVLQDFIRRAPEEMAKAVYSASRERSVGLGLMGFHSFLQSQGVPFESAMAKSWNMRMFKHLRKRADAASVKLAYEKGACPDWEDANALAVELGDPLGAGAPQRFSHKIAVAPTASISIICGGTSAGIEPIPANVYTHKTLSGSFEVRSPYLEKLIWERYGEVSLYDQWEQHCRDQWVEEQWRSILEHGGSVQHLDFLTEDEKAVYKTAFELDQRWIVELAADRAPEVDQAQSVNLFIPGDVDKWDLHMLHWQAWEKGVKSLYYLRSKSVQRADFAGGDVLDFDPSLEEKPLVLKAPTNYEECLACQ